jgi:hypothetical protein
LLDRRIVFYYHGAKVYPENLLSFNDRPKRMSQPSKFITYSIGGLSLFAGVLFIALAPLMYALQVPLKTCLMSAICSVFPLVIAAALLWPSKRSIAIRALGIMLLASGSVMLVSQLMSRFGVGFEGDPKFSSRGIGFSIMLASAGFWMAMKGRWIGSS